MSHDSADGSIGSEADMADPVVKYIIKYMSPGHSVWQRSGNLNRNGVSNWNTTYDSLAEAEEEARYQQRLMGPKGFTYKAVALLN